MEESVIDFASNQMKALHKYRELLDFSTCIVPNTRVLCCLHVTKETGVLVQILKSIGLNVSLVASNPLSTNIRVKEELIAAGVEVFGENNDDSAQLRELWIKLLKKEPEYIFDDGGDLVDLAVRMKISSIKGCCEETTSGVTKELVIQKSGMLTFPVIAVNNARTKNLMDNHFGTAQSVLYGIINSTKEIIAGKRLVVCGYGNCGSGIAQRARGMGANVSISEIDPVKALQAMYDGFHVGKLLDICSFADIIVTATGCLNVVTHLEVKQMKDGCILANAGHSNCEISVSDIELNCEHLISRDKYDIYDCAGKKITLLGRGRIINLVAGDGHPSEIMSLSYSSQLAGLHYILTNNLPPGLHCVPASYENDIAFTHLSSKDVQIDKLTGLQKKYLFG